MVALAVLGMSVVALFQLFSMTLRTTKKADDYSRALFYARSIIDEAYSMPDPEDESFSIEFDGDFEGSKRVTAVSASEDGKSKLFEITVTVTWPPEGSLTLTGLRTVYEAE